MEKEIEIKEKKVNILIPRIVSRTSDIDHPFIVMEAPDNNTAISFDKARMKILKAGGKYDGGSLCFGYMKDGVLLDLKRDLTKTDTSIGKGFLQVANETIKHFLEIPLNNVDMPPVQNSVFYSLSNQYNGFYSPVDLMGATIVGWFSGLPQPQNFLVGCINVKITYDAGPWTPGWEHF